MIEKSLINDPKLKPILDDNKSGSTELLINIIEYFNNIVWTSNHNEEFINLIKKYLSSFPSIQSFLDQVTLLLDKKEQLSYFLTQRLNEIYEDIEKVFESLPEILKTKNTIITISNSFSIRYIVQKLHRINPNLSLVIQESRPQFEGRVLAEKLAEQGISTRIITEAMASKYVENSDFALVGADIILPDKSIVNKTGTRNLAILCNHFQKPFYAVADKKKTSEIYDFDAGINSSSEILNNKNDLIYITNYYFERVETELITALYTA